MSDLRTEMEKELHGLILEVMDFLAKPKLGRERFRDVMGQLRNAKVKLENRAFGCSTGKHEGECKCTPTI